MEDLRTVTLTIVYDNNAYDAGLRTSWGFSCWVETDETTVLFDTGGDGPTLMHNLRELALDPQEIDLVVLSHAHGDHTGGLGALLDAGLSATVYAPTSFPEAFKTDVRARTGIVEVREATMIAPGITTTGEVGSALVEQALAVETNEGLVVVTGCAHPGIVQMVRQAKETADGEIALVMGGFHLGGASSGQIERIIADLRDLGVKRIAPCHCTGDKARHAFVDAFGEDAVLAGVGWSTEFVSRR
jgi:7,8-dihydropterin-6-yl-methyl-4-(beta-D-ribofuranosyl)aminobenzene 5'-phosphate synthase